MGSVSTSAGTVEPASPARRELNRLRTHRALEAAALELFAEQGYATTTIEEIADRAEVSLRTFFRYFPTKDRTVFSELRRSAADVIAQLRDRPSGDDPWTRLCAAQCAQARQLDAPTLRAIKTRYRLIRSTPELLARHAELTRLEQAEVVEALHALSPAHPVADLRLLVSVAYTAVWHAVDQWASGDTTDELPALLERSFTTLSALLGPTPSRSVPRAS